MNDKTKFIWVSIAALVTLVASWQATGVLKSRNDVANKLLEQTMQVREYSIDKEQYYKQDFETKCLLARMVYQYSWYKSIDTQLGKLQIPKYYAMNLQEYSDLIDLSWEYNRKLSIPIDSWENYIMLAKWIYESAICTWIEHKTGEIIRMTGYTADGFGLALYYYLYEMSIQPGHAFYIQELFNNKNMNVRDIEILFRDYRRVVKFDYAFISYLLSKYDYKWEWALTAFHFGVNKPDYWWYDKELKVVPNKRLNGEWASIWLREYYQTVYEIAHSIATGRLERISKYEQKVATTGKWRKQQENYVNTLRLKFKGEERYNELKAKCDQLVNDLDKYKQLNNMLIEKMGKLNELNLKQDYNKQVISTNMRKDILKLKKEIEENYKKMRGVK